MTKTFIKTFNTNFEIAHNAPIKKYSLKIDGEIHQVHEIFLMDISVHFGIKRFYIDVFKLFF